ncbi:hypothetical protein D1007_25147 [Hordeum vulgare]|nr:hypothetical protein D1007_25147 [Hordeum vulgare]
MADCYTPDMDELRSLPREIFDDIGIADATPPSATTVEDVAVHLTVILVSKEGLARLPPPPTPAPYNRPHVPQVSAPGGTAPVVYGGGSNGGGVPTPWPALPYSPPLWQCKQAMATEVTFLLPSAAPKAASSSRGGAAGDETGG